jgi:hypothetical protein
MRPQSKRSYRGMRPLKYPLDRRRPAGRAVLLFFVVSLFILPTFVHARSVGTWYFDSSDDGATLYAATVNDSGNMLGQYCTMDSGDCIWLVAFTTACDVGNRYPVLANSDSEASHLEVYCAGKLGNSGLYSYAFTDFDLMDGIISKGSRIGIAFPLQGDQFIIVRFDLRGAVAALTQMRAAAQEKVKRANHGTRDQTL